MSSSKVALITGVTGQDGAYLAELLLKKGYEVHGIKRRSSLFNTDRIDHLYQDPHVDGRHFTLHYGDLTDSTSLVRIIQQVQPDEIYNLAAMSHVAVSFQEPEYTANADGIGTLRILEAIRILGLTKKTRFYQASTSELYGLVQEIPQKETTPFYPRSPYAVAKMYAYWITVNYREAYGIYACNGVLFNHESPLRGETFVTRKITRAIARIALGLQDCLYLGNMSALRDWGHARDYVEMQWLMLQQDQPEDFVIATGVQYSGRQFVERAAAELGVTVRFEGEGEKEILLTAHYDAVKLRDGTMSQGVVDNAGSVVALIEAAKILRDKPLSHRVRVIFFDQEELGLIGARKWIEAHGVANVAAVVNSDVAAYGDTLMYGQNNGQQSAFVTRATQELCAERAMQCVGFPEYPPSDDRAFSAAGVPVVSLGFQDQVGAHQMWLAFNGGKENGLAEGFVPQVFRVIHSKDDAIEAVEGATIATAGATYAALIQKLDAQLR